MSLNKFIGVGTGKIMGLQIGAASMDCENFACSGTLDMSNGTDLNAHNLTVDNDLKVNGAAFLGGVDYNTPDIGIANYSLHTDGLGLAFWAPDDTGSGDITYNGAPPTVAGQLCRFSTVDGSSADQSAITDDGLTLDLNGQDIGNVGNVDGVDVGTFKDNYDANIDQAVKSTSSPLFENLDVNTLLSVDTVNEKTLDNGVAIDGVILKDGLVDGVDVVQLETDFQALDDDYTLNIDQAVKVASNPTFNSLILNGNFTCNQILNINSIGAASGLMTFSNDGDIQWYLTNDQGNDDIRFGEKTADNPVLTLTQDGVGSGQVVVGNFATNTEYKLPKTSSGVADQSVMVYNSSNREMEFKVQSGFMLGFGGNLNNVPARAEAWGDANLSTNDTPGADNSMVAPIDCKLLAISYNTTNGDNTTTVDILNGVTIVWNFNLVGASGVEDTIDNPSLLFSKGDKLTVRVTGGTAPGQSNFSVYMK